MIIDPQELVTLTGPGVYLFYRDDEIFYIGATTQGLGRCLSGMHKMALLFKDGLMYLEFIPTSTGTEAFRLEEELIKSADPICNRTPQAVQRRYRMKKRFAENKQPSQILDDATVAKIRAINIMDELSPAAKRLKKLCPDYLTPSERGLR